MGGVHRNVSRYNGRTNCNVRDSIPDRNIGSVCENPCISPPIRGRDVGTSPWVHISLQAALQLPSWSLQSGEPRLSLPCH